jgi:hypothetical protein
MITVFKMDQCLELDGNLSSISASIEGSLPENTASWKAQEAAHSPGNASRPNRFLATELVVDDSDLF